MLTSDPGFQLIQSRFPHIAARLVAAWGQKGFASYIDGLLQTRREGQALGFPPEIIAALNELRAWHARVHDAEESEPALPAADLRRLEADANFRVINQCHPHIGKKLKDAWATCLFSPFINELFRDSRGGTRQGFAKEVSMALFRLQEEHDRVFPETVREMPDIWALEHKGL